MHAYITFYLFIDGHLGDFHLLSTVNDVPRIMVMQIPFCILSFNSFEYITISGIDGSYGILFLIFLGTELLFSIVVAPFYNHTNNAQ